MPLSILSNISQNDTKMMAPNLLERSGRGLLYQASGSESQKDGQN